MVWVFEAITHAMPTASITARRWLTQDVVRFAVLGHGYARSATQVWHEGRLLAGADAASFALTTAVPDVHIDATDVRAAYWLGERVKRTPPAISESIK